MKRFKIIYDPEFSRKKFMFTNLNLERINPPITISREKPIEEEIVFNSKKKSELVEYEDDEYKKLKAKEACPLLIEDCDNVSYLGKLQTFNNNNSTYFTFHREGDEIYITPIRKWYRFTQKITSLDNIDDDDDDLTKIAPDIPNIPTNVESDKEEIDYEDEFDDDEGEDFNFKVSEEKKLSKAGQKLRNIVENLEKESESEEEEEDEVEIKQKKLTNGEIRKYFITKTMPLRDLIRELKKSYDLDTEEKKVLKNFVSESCTYETDPETNEKVLKLKN